MNLSTIVYLFFFAFTMAPVQAEEIPDWIKENPAFTVDYYCSPAFDLASRFCFTYDLGVDMKPLSGSKFQGMISSDSTYDLPPTLTLPSPTSSLILPPVVDRNVVARRIRPHRRGRQSSSPKIERLHGNNMVRYE